MCSAICLKLLHRCLLRRGWHVGDGFLLSLGEFNIDFSNIAVFSIISPCTSALCLLVSACTLFTAAIWLICSCWTSFATIMYCINWLVCSVCTFALSLIFLLSGVNYTAAFFASFLLTWFALSYFALFSVVRSIFCTHKLPKYVFRLPHVLFISALTFHCRMSFASNQLLSHIFCYSRDHNLLC